mgnify:CR=1 FL=1
MCEVCEITPLGEYFICDNCGLGSDQVCNSCHIDICFQI